MTTVIPVRFAYAVRDLWFDPGETGAAEGDHLICSTERGTEVGLATSDPREVTDEELGRKTGNAVLKPVLRVADERDLERADDLARMGEEALPTFRRLVNEAELDMKPVGVEYLFGRERVVCYFAADERVDFRGLVRNLSHELHERIDMRQIGVREEAAVVGGFGHCGQELCCSRIGLSFEPVSIRMAKEQDLPLTSNKISGACGRLMCCLRYEFEAYRDFKGRAPKRNAVIDTPLGKAKIVEYDTPKEQLALRLENGKVVRIPLGEMVASEAAVKKSEELHCPCRPDTVVRASLDKLSSPDVQMALAELDRKMGVVVEDDLTSDDLFVETSTRKRRNRRSSSKEATPEQTVDAPAESPRRKRRRRSTKGAAGAETQGEQTSPAVQGQAAQGQPSQDGAPQEEKRSRRRRRRRSGSAAQTSAQNAGQTGAQEGAVAERRTSEAKPDGDSGAKETPAEGTKETKPRRRRRHRSSSGGGSQASQGQGTQQGKQNQSRQAQSQQTQEQTERTTAPKPRRRPGDHGGQNGQGNANVEGAPRRRRRRRSRGRGDNGADATT